MGVAVVTDSAADLGAERLRAEGLAMVPLTVHFGTTTFYDQVDLDAPGFWSRLAESRTLPRTAAPSPGAFATVYRDAVDRGDEVVSVHLSGQLSATVESAQAAAGMVQGPVTVVDGRSASLGTGLLAMWAARSARAGWSAAAVATGVRDLAGALRVYFSLDTLEFLARGGRIGQGARLLGTMLDVKPILTLADGQVRPLRRVRGAAQVAAGLTAWLDHDPPADPVVAALASSPPLDEALAADVRRRVEERCAVRAWVTGQIGPVIGVHAGPGALGLIVLPLPAEAARAWAEGEMRT